ncbi:MAG: hypothetical protein DRH17_03740 [Deltaproteobacteria bacterium]|nr:MAG: hypothetical protein DRH17_03740 [Deltaproteobacteria bacterium]
MKELTRQPPEKQQILPSLSPKELLRLPGKKALELILESPRPVTLVQSLADEDLFWLVQEVGPEDALPILSFASNDQWQYLLDLELWAKDRLEIDSVNRWLGFLLKADPERFLIWGLREHIELIELHLFKNIEVRIKKEDESLSDFDESFFTLDGVFFIRILHEKYHETIRQFLDRLAEHDLNQFHKVLLELAAVLPAEVEENIYRLRNVRLAEKGFLPFEEAVGIYQYLNPQSLLEKEPQLRKVTHEQQPPKPVPVSTSLLIQDQDLFYMSLKRIEDGHILERLQMEFAAMCNQIISADGFVVRDKDGLTGVVRKACGYLSAGLEKMTGGDPQKATGLLKRFPLHQIFRVGYGAALELKWRAEKWLRGSWFAGHGFGLSFWDDNWAGILEGLFKKRPVFYTGFSEVEPYREFKSLEDITYCDKVLDQVISIDHLLSLVFARPPGVHPIRSYQPVTYKNLFLTCWAGHHLGLPEETRSIAAEDLRTFFADLWMKEARPYRVDIRMKQAFLDWLQIRSERPISEILGRLGKTLDHLFEELEREYGRVSLEDLDPRYIKHFLVTP